MRYAALSIHAPNVHVPPGFPQVTYPHFRDPHKLSLMAFTRTQIGIAASAGALLVLVFVGYLWWLSNQGPVLARSEDHDPLTGLPVSIRMNPLRDRSTEKAANKFIRELRDGHCDEVLSKWEHDYHKKYAKYICKSESEHPLLSWELVDWEEATPLIILHYRGTRQSASAQSGTDQDLFTVTTEHKGGDWVVTKYDAMY
jgi:hypothetical protein